MIGCGGGPPSTSNPGTPPPHGGNLIKLPGGKEFVEVVQKTAASATAPMTGEVTFYFLKEDGTTPISPAPSTGTLDGRQAERSPSSPKGMGSPPRTGRPCSPRPGLDGILSVELDGKPVKLPLGVR